MGPNMGLNTGVVETDATHDPTAGAGAGAGAGASGGTSGPPSSGPSGGKASGAAGCGAVLVRMLLEAGADPNGRDEGGATPLDYFHVAAAQVHHRNGNVDNSFVRISLLNAAFFKNIRGGLVCVF